MSAAVSGVTLNGTSKVGDGGAGPADRVLLERMRRGEEAALEAIYDRHHRLVYGTALRILHNPQEAEDLTVEVFYELWCRVSQYDAGRSEVVGYLLLLTRSRAIDHRRYRQRKRRGCRDGAARLEGQVLAGDDAGPALRAMLHERRAWVRQLVAQLDANHLAPLEMSFQQGLSHRQIAQQLNLPLGTVKTRIRKALVQLRGLAHDRPMHWS